MAIMESRPVRRSERSIKSLGRRPGRAGQVQIIDLSREGMRIEIPRTLKVAPPPPVFDVSVPMLGVALNVRRLWTGNPTQSIRPATRVRRGTVEQLPARRAGVVHARRCAVASSVSPDVQ